MDTTDYQQNWQVFLTNFTLFAETCQLPVPFHCSSFEEWESFSIRLSQEKKGPIMININEIQEKFSVWRYLAFLNFIESVSARKPSFFSGYSFVFTLSHKNFGKGGLLDRCLNALGRGYLVSPELYREK